SPCGTHRHCRREVPLSYPPTKDTVLLINYLEHLTLAGNPLRPPHKEETPGAKGIMQSLRQPPLRILIAINEEVRTRNKIKPGKRRILCNVMYRKDAQLADRFLRAVIISVVPDPALEALRRHVRFNEAGIPPKTCGGDGVVTQVG